MLAAVLLALVVGLQSADTASASLRRPPALRAWQASRVAYGYAIHQRRPGYVVVDTERRSRYRIAVTGHEPGYLFLEDGPDVTVTLVERRGYQLWVRDPFTGNRSRWL